MKWNCTTSNTVALSVLQEFRALAGLYSKTFIIDIEDFSNKTSKISNSKPNYNFPFVGNQKATL